MRAARGRSTRALEAMVRYRFAAAAVFAWAAVQFYGLRAIGYHPDQHPRGWIIGAVALLLAGALWFRLRWSTSVVSLFAALFICLYGYIFATQGLSPCAAHEVVCEAHLVAQPLLAVVVLGVLFVPWPLTTRSSGP